MFLGFLNNNKKVSKDVVNKKNVKLSYENFKAAIENNEKPLESNKKNIFARTKI